MSKYYAEQGYITPAFNYRDRGTIRYPVSDSLAQLGKRIAACHQMPSFDKRRLDDQIYVFKGSKSKRCIGEYRINDGKLVLQRRMDVHYVESDY
jgi:hypothetical protein|tara:strand:- start:824 stop:1105 length:282 start_codon:yes stop_codon:yes gene_type:complete